ncbi:type II secretion system F family protein [Sneathiella marina]|uniref:Type II secretion system F family protein n=1 Tax=Sneathiella marina TaxID=2950108 RepID=A0ABY4W9Y4_9PROT|nr:type II secretion system F family protein [Sneathiella marina]USG62948.1 type II secretion system F family protein [Sneathiella marina]
MVDLVSLLPDFLRSEDMLALIAGGASLAVVLMMWRAFLVKDALPGRIKSLEKRRTALKENIANETKQRSKLIVRENLMHRVVQKMQLMRGERARVMAAKLAQGGWRSKDALVTYLFAKISLPLLFTSLALMYLLGTNPWDWDVLVCILASIGAGFIGYLLPDTLVKNKVSKRYEAIRKTLPDALDLLVICTEAGLNLDSGLDRVCREVANSAPELADEFGLTSIELGFLPDRKQALGNLASRVDFQAMTTLVNTLLQTEKYGTPLAVALRVLAAEMREERLMKAEEKAARLPAIMTVPMIVFILPALFIVLIGPAVLRAIDAFN